MVILKVLIAIELIILHVNAAPSIEELKFYPPVGPRIVGGIDAKPGDAPFQCSLQINGNHFCGCAILSKNWIVTASHCIEGQSINALRVVVGITNLTEAGTAYTATKLIKHSRYNKPYFANDIGLIKINSSIQMSQLIQPINFSPHEVPENCTLQLTGWGRLSAGGRLPKTLQKINLRSLSYKTCSDIYNNSDVDIGHICTLTKAGEGACNGDSGGPLTLNGKLVGIVNWGVPCAKGKPDAFARVSYYHDWLRTKMNEE